MKIPFQFIALPYERFANLFNQSDKELRSVGALWKVVDQKPGFPCRVSLTDAEIGERVLLVQFTHHDVGSPYRASGAVYVRRDANTASPAVNEIPFMFTHRLLSVRGYDEAGMLVDSEVVDGSDLEDAICRFFTDENVSYLHLHNAAPGCYNCSVVRA